MYNDIPYENFIMIKFIFDFDGTITKNETIPIIAKHFGVKEDIESLTIKSIEGSEDFAENFAKRVNILSGFPVSEIRNLLENIETYPMIIKFIKENIEDCVIATGNLGCWVSGILKKIGCLYYHSDALVENDNIVGIINIINKRNIVESYKRDGYKVVFIGDGRNDVEAMEVSDIAIGACISHEVPKSIEDISDCLVYDEFQMYEKLNNIL